MRDFENVEHLDGGDIFPALYRGRRRGAVAERPGCQAGEGRDLLGAAHPRAVPSGLGR